MNQIPFGIVLVIVLSVGCSKKPAASAQTAAPEPTNAVSTSENSPALSMPIERTQPVIGTVDPAMTEQLHVFMQKNGRLPQDFAELARVQLDTRPRPPKGLKWAIDPATAEVKLVKQ